MLQIQLQRLLTNWDTLKHKYMIYIKIKILSS